jgi:hypothetical protein
MINVSHSVCMHLPTASGDPSTPRLDGSQVKFSSFLIQIHTHESNFHVTWFSYGSNTRDVVGRVSRSQADFDMAATATTSSRASRPKFHHSSPTFGPGILATAVGTSTWRASPIVGNASVDDIAAISTFFFATDGKTHIRAFQFLYS